MKKRLFPLVFFQFSLLMLGKAQTNIPTVPSIATAIPHRIPGYSEPSEYYFRSIVPMLATQDTAVVSYKTSVDSVSVATQYYDNLHRPLEMVAKQASPLKKDNVAISYYDEFGRPSINYLPYVAQTGNTSDGKFKSNPFVNDSAFYKANFPNENIYYSENIYDGSPLNRIVKSMAQGNSWGGSFAGSSKLWRANNLTDSVVIWSIGAGEDDVPYKAGYYEEGSLMVEEIIDEKGNEQIIFKDETGNIVLTKSQEKADPSPGHWGWLCTYYVFDEMMHLRVVIPPKATLALNTITINWDFDLSPSLIPNLCFTYFYDFRGQVTVLGVPGKGRIYSAYDLLGRPVMSQDPHLRSTNEWAFSLYDGQNRVIKSGLITSSLSKDEIISQASASNSYPQLSGTYTITAETYYDDYSWITATGAPLTGSLDASNINSANFNTSYNAAPDYAQQISSSLRIRGAVTGRKEIILNSNTYLYTVNLFDNRGRCIQSKKTNYSGGTDISTVQYNFIGALLRNHLFHQKAGNNSQNHKILTKYSYDHVGRIKSVTKNFDGQGDKIISQYSYNEFGQLQTKTVGGGIDEQHYSYNIRGWLTGINKNFVETCAAGYFGETISYDQGFTNNQLNGCVAGIKWKSNGDGIARAFGFGYDLNNRLSKADFSQQNEGSTAWTKDKADFSVSNLSYDANGNIHSMTQRGMQIGSSSIIDSLNYQYFANSNQLQKVSDQASAFSTNGSGPVDFADSTNTDDDYTYDANGNINRDNNRHMHTPSNAPGAVFNVLDKADSIVIAGKATTYYYYNASGHLLAKKIKNYTGMGAVEKNYLYLDGFVYLNDTLQYALIEGGRVHYAKKRNSQTGAVYYAYEYDYFVTDHMGNVRSLLTEGRDTSTYQATMEPANSTVEDALFANEYTPVNTIFSKPPAFDNIGENQQVSRLNASLAVDLKTGPSLILKVMAGDKVQVNTYSYYDTPAQSPPGGINLLPDLLSILTGGIISNSGGKLNQANFSAISNALSPNVVQFLDNDRPYDITKPKAYLNWVLFDEQFNVVAANTDVLQVQPGSGKQALVAPLQTIAKNGYFYVYVSNESPQDVYFDDLTIKHFTGPLVQEQSYYPFGLEMVGICSKALNRFASSYKFNGGVDLEEDDGINYYNTFYRKYDAQLGRFTGIDPMAATSFSMSPFQFSDNNPITYNDPFGDRKQFADGQEYQLPDMRSLVDEVMSSYGWGSGGGGGGGGGMTEFDYLSTYAGLKDKLNSFRNRRVDQYGYNEFGQFGLGHWSYHWGDGAPGDGTTLTEVRSFSQFTLLPSFATLLSNYPTPYSHRPDRTPATGYKTVDDNDENSFLHFNQCAIRMSIALSKSGVNIKGIKKNITNPGGQIYSNGNVIGAKNLAVHLKSIFGDPVVYDGSKDDISTLLANETGIIYFNHFPETDENGNSALDWNSYHIDLWDKGTIMMNEVYDTPTSATVIWFWPVK